MSLRHRLTLLLGSAFIAIWLATATWLMLDLRQEIRHTLDERLAASARMVAGLVAQWPEEARRALRDQPIATEQLGVPSGLACRITSLRGGIIARSSHAALPPVTSAPGFHTSTIDGMPWRTFTLEHGDTRVTIGDRIEERTTLDRAILGAAAVPVIVSLAGSLLVLWFGLARALRPLERMRAALARRHADSLEPLPRQALPPEVEALVAALNSLFARLRESIERERRFTGDAAHELRSPLTALRSHIQVAQMAGGSTAETSLDKAVLAADQLQKTLDQLLLLARLDSNVPLGEGDGTVGELLSEAVAQVRTGADRLDIHLEAGVEELRPALPSALAVVALRNLIDNALMHGGSDGDVTVAIRRDAAAVHFAVRDSGPGFDASAPVARFRRGRDSAGAGLGLAIVSAIAERCGGALAFERQSDGFTCRLALPVRPEGDGSRRH